MKLTVQIAVTNLFAEPDVASELVSQLLLGAPVTVEDRRDGPTPGRPTWLRGRGPADYVGWTPADSLVETAELEPSPAGAGLKPAPTPPSRISALYANLRHAPSRRCGPVICASFGTILPVADRDDEWVGLALPGGRTGWVEESRVEQETPRPLPRLLDTARLFLGVPYLWGGTSSFGIDCSGYVQAVFGAHGIPLPRDANDQAALGAPIDRDAIETGDLLYFAAMPEASRAGITHVALAVDRDNILHALGGRCVVETPVDAGGMFWGARRLQESEHSPNPAKAAFDEGGMDYAVRSVSDSALSGGTG